MCQNSWSPLVSVLRCQGVGECWRECAGAFGGDAQALGPVGDLDESSWSFIGWVGGRERRHTAQSQVYPGTQMRS